MSTIVLTGGGTAGHIIPNITLCEYLKEHFDKIIYIGGGEPEKSLITSLDYVQYFEVSAPKLSRSLDIKNLLIPLNLYKGYKKAKKILKQNLPSIVFSKGGYVSLPTVLAAKSLNIPIVAHESDFSLGLANKLVANKINAICTTFRETANNLPNGIYTGPPLKKQTITPSQQNRIRTLFNLNQKPLCLVMGGSQGSQQINQLLLHNLDKITKTHQVLHITGKNKSTTHSHPDYHSIEYTQDLPTIMSISDIAITRGGSNALFELLSFGVPMLIIPLQKNSRGDQIQNAQYFETKGYGISLISDNLTDDLFLSKFTKLLESSVTLKAAMHHALPSDSIQKIISTILKYKKD